MQNFLQGFDGAMDFVKSALGAFFASMNTFLGFFSNFWLGAALITALFAVMLAWNIMHGRREFSRLIKRPQVLAVCSMMIAINVILGYFTLPVSSYLRIGFGFITMPVITMLYGPLIGCAAGLLQDVVSFVLKPTGAYLFTLTLNVGIGGMIYGAMLYKKRVGFWRVFCTKMIVIFVVNIMLNSIALAPTVGSGLVGILPSRIIKNVLLLPIQSMVVYAILKTVELKSRLTAV